MFENRNFPVVESEVKTKSTGSVIKLAVLDMYNGAPNQGMKNILEMLDLQVYPFTWNRFDVRGANQLPGMDYDIFISSGGPGDPREGDGIWDRNYFNLIDEIWEWNKYNKRKKYVMFICHSFQMFCLHFKLGQITKRHSTSFGILPMHKTAAGKTDPIFSRLPDPFYAADHRDYQLVQPDLEVFKKFGAKILCLEKIRDHVDYERAIMAVRLSDEFFGTQFHPEADPIGLLEYYRDKTLYDKAVANYGKKKVDDTVSQIHDPYKVSLTNKVIIPSFLRSAVSSLFDNP
jgi:homoserine O-succinyltransferase/O-acetyltransferase